MEGARGEGPLYSGSPSFEWAGAWSGTYRARLHVQGAGGGDSNASWIMGHGTPSLNKMTDRHL